MLPTSLLAVLTATISFAAALPPGQITTHNVTYPYSSDSLTSRSTNTTLNPRKSGGHYYCQDAGFKGTCGYSCCMKDFCLNYMPVDYGKISSVGPDPGTVCWFHDQKDCFGDYREVRYPGVADLKTVKFDNVIKSWQCFDDWNPGKEGPAPS